MSSSSPYRFRAPTVDDAAMLLDWRTRPDVTRHMFTDIENPDVERQREWISAMNDRDDVRHFVIEVENVRPIGWLGFTEINWKDRRCSSGLYIGDATDRKKYSGLLGMFIFDYCFYVLDMNKLVNQFMGENSRLIKIQEYLGFREVGVFKDHVWKYGEWHDVHVLELHRAAHEARPRLFSLDDTLAAFGVSADSSKPRFHDG